MSNQKVFAETGKKLVGYINPSVKTDVTSKPKQVPVAKSTEKIAIKKVALKTGIHDIVLTNRLIGQGKPVFTGAVPMAFKADLDEIVNEIEEKNKPLPFEMKVVDGCVSLDDFAKFHNVNPKELYILCQNKGVKCNFNGKEGKLYARLELLEKLDLYHLQMAQNLTKRIFGK
jgi:hypothetical protein